MFINQFQITSNDLKSDINSNKYYVTFHYNIDKIMIGNREFNLVTK